MLNNGCVPSQSGPTEVTADFRFTRVMAEQAARARLTLDDDQLSLIARLDALGQQLVSTTGSPQGVYVWGRTGRGKSFILDHFFASLPLAARRRVHFHHFFRELHQRLNAPGAPDLQTVMRQMTSGCRLLCFDEFHLHDPGDAMLIKALLEHLFQHGIVLLATSNYPPEMLLPNPLYHDRFLPSIALIRAHLTVVALNGEEDYRERHLSQDNAFCSGRMWVNPNAQQRQLYDLQSLPGEPVSLTVGYRTLLAAAASPALLHFTFTQLCQAATAVMDYLTLCESYAVWLLDEVPPLATVGPAAQQRFINVIDVLYEKQIRLLLVTDPLRPGDAGGRGGTGGYSTNAESPATAAAGGIRKTPRREPGREDYRSKRSRFITLVQAATKSCTSFCCPSAQAYTSARARSTELEPNTRSTRVALYFASPVLRSLPVNSSALSSAAFQTVAISSRLTKKSLLSTPTRSVNTPCLLPS